MITRNIVDEWGEEFAEIERRTNHAYGHDQLGIGIGEYLILCYQYQIKTKGERSLIVIGGNVTHAVIKKPKADNFLVHEGFGGTTELHDPTPDEVAFAEQVYQAVTNIVDACPAYLRVDMIYDNDHKLALMELAAGTAHLWLTKNPAAADALVTYINNLLQTSRSQPHCTRSL
eukprot:scaffold11842_cov151-Amphora_coffeaeformis.AAC.1